MKENKLRFVVFAPPYNSDSGGGIALLLLCERLRELGLDAYIWPSTVPYNILPRGWKEVGKVFRRLMHWITKRPFPTGPFSVPLATRKMVKDAVVIYPEVVTGNPLRSRNVVRWFLHRPGYHTGQIKYGTNEIYFFYQDAFNDPSINNQSDNRLTVTYLHPSYKNLNKDGRTGVCVLVRKGKDRIGDAPLRGEVIDGMSHEGMAAAFNRAEYLQSFDVYSMYTVFAAMCGCTPVIEPTPGVLKEQWVPREEDRYGLAYGWDDVEWAVRTRDLLIERLARDRQAEDQMVLQFVDKTKRFFRVGGHEE